MAAHENICAAINLEKSACFGLMLLNLYLLIGCLDLMDDCSENGHFVYVCRQKFNPDAFGVSANDYPVHLTTFIQSRTE